MRTRTPSHLGATCAMLLGASYVLVGATFFLNRSALTSFSDLSRYWQNLVSHPVQHLLYYWLWVAGALLAFAAVPAISARVRSTAEDWVAWGTRLAYLGFSVVAISNLRALSIKPRMAAAWLAGDAEARRLIDGIDPWMTVDPNGWLAVGAVGAWVLIVSIAGLAGRGIPRALGWLGIAVGACYWIAVGAAVLQSSALNALAAGLGGIVLAPAWYIGLGVALRRPAAVGQAPERAAA